MGLNSPQRCPLSPLPMFQPRLPSCAALLLALGCWFPFSAVAQTLNVQNDVVRVANLVNTTATLSGTAELHVTGTGDPITGSVINLTSPDAWFFMDNILASQVVATILGRVRVNGVAAVVDSNVRVTQYLQGAVVIPHAPDFAPLEVFDGANFAGPTKRLQNYVEYNDVSLGPLKQTISSFRLKRGYMATFATQENGMGASKVYVAQEGDVEVGVLPANLNNSIRFVRIFPWRWVGKKGFAGNIWQNLRIQWYYNWNLDRNSSRDVEYVPIRQTRWWPGLDQDWKARGANHLLGYNEPDHVDQANLSVGDAVYSWPDLLSSGLRVGAPAVTDGGLNWLYSFIDQCDAAGLRVDFVPVHYYRSYWNAADPDGAATQFYNFLKGIYDRTKRPLWVTEFNNGANWTADPDPTQAQQQATVAKMIGMLDNAPFVERYAIYNWVEDVRRVVWDDGSLTGAGTVYRDNLSPVNYVQELPDGGGSAAATYLFDGSARDASGNGNDATLVGGTVFPPGRAGQALSLDGSDAYLQLPARLGDSTDFTFAAWVNWNGGANWQRILDLGDGTSKHLFLTPKSGAGNLRFTLKNGGGEQQLNHTAALAAGVWTHVAVTLSGDTGKLFVNGTLVNTNTGMTINPADLGTRQNYLGKSQFADPLFAGKLDDVRFLNSALTDAQVSVLVSALLPQFTAESLPQAPAVPLQPWTGTLAGSASGGTGTRSFTKLGGPAWLAVAADGRLTGMPTLADVGLNTFQVRVSVPGGGSDLATVTVPVGAPGGLVARYPFNGNANAAVGILPGVATGSPGYSAGRIGSALILDGTNDYITLPPGLAKTDEITIATWMMWNGSSNWQRLFDFGNGTSEYFFLSPKSATGRMAFTIRAKGIENTVDTAMPASGAWTHVAVTVGGGSMKLFVNGANVASGATSLRPSDIQPASNFIGRSQWPDPLFSGRVDEFLVFNRALSAAEVAGLPTALPPVFTSDPFSRPAGAMGQTYEQTLAGLATDANPESALTFSKVAGPRWLTVDGYGRLSGVPGASDSGMNRFIVRVSDPTGLASEAVLTINVPGPADLLVHYQWDGNLISQTGAFPGTATGGPVYETGWYDRAMRFDGTDDLVTLPAGLLSTVSDLTVAARVRWDGGANWQRIFDFGNNLTQYLVLTPRSGSGTLRFTIKDGGAEQILESTPLVVGDWAHVAVTLTGNTGTLYLNGMAVDTRSITIDPLSFNPALNYLGESQFAADPMLKGAVDDFRLYRRGLSAAEVAALAIPPAAVGVPDNTYGGWAAGQALTPSQSGAAVDPDGDGLSNLMEFLLGGDPLTPDSSLLPRGEVRSAAELGATATPGKNYLSLQARLRRDRSAILVTPEAAATLDALATPAPAVQAGLPVADGAYDIYTWHHPVALEDAPAGSGFLRLRVTWP